MAMASSFEFRIAVPAPRMCVADEIFRNGSFKAFAASVPAASKIGGGKEAPSRGKNSFCAGKVKARSSWDEYARLSFGQEDTSFRASYARTSSTAPRKWSIKQFFLPRCMAVEAKPPNLLRVSQSQSQKVCSTSSVLPFKARGCIASYDLEGPIPTRSHNERRAADADPAGISSTASIGGAKATADTQNKRVLRSFSANSVSCSHNKRTQQSQKTSSPSCRDSAKLLRRKTFLPYRQTVLPLLA